MAQKLIDKSTLQLYKSGMTSLRESLGRKIVLYLPGGEEICPNCVWDSVSMCSAGIYFPKSPYPSNIPGPFEFTGICPVCKGVGKYTIQEVIKKIKAVPIWLKGKDRQVTVAGQSFEADYMLSNVDIKNYERMTLAKKIFVDDVEVELIGRPKKEGLKDLIKFTAYARAR